MSSKRNSALYRIYLAVLGVAAAVAVVGGVFTAWAATSSAAPTVAPQNAGEPSVTGTTRVGQVLRTTRGTWTGTAPITYAFRWFRCDGPGAPDASDCGRISNAAANSYTSAPGGRRLPHPQPGRREQRRRLGEGDLEPDERRDLATSDEHEGAVHLGHGQGRQHAAGEPWRVGGRAADHVLVRLAPLQRPGRQLQRDPGCHRHGVRGPRRRHRPDDPRPGHRPERPRHDVGDLEPDRCGRRRHASAADDGRDRRRLAPGSRRPHDRRPGSVQPEPGHEQDGADHGPRAGHCAWRPPGERSTRVHACNAACRRGPDADNGRRRLGHHHARPEQARSRSRGTASTCSSS